MAESEELRVESEEKVRQSVFTQQYSQMPSVVTRPTSCATRVSPRGPSLALRAIHLVSRQRG